MVATLTRKEPIMQTSFNPPELSRPWKVALLAVSLCLTALAGWGYLWREPSAYEKMEDIERQAQAIMAARDAAPKPLQPRDEFEQTVLWKTPAEVIAILGRPDYTSKSGYWLYRHSMTYDPISRKPDSHAAIWFSGDVASSVDY